MQPLRHRLEFLIRKPLERLPDHLERTALVVPHREPIVRQPTLSTPAPPLRRGNCEVQVVRGFDLEPLLPSFSDRVRRLQLLRHEAFVPGDERLLEERLDLLLALRDAAGRQQVRRHEPLEELPAHAVRLIDQRSSVEVEDIEQVQLQWNLFLGRFDAVHTPEAAHEILKWKRLALPVHRDDLAFEQKLGRGQCLRNRDDLGKAGRDIAQSPTEDLHRIALAMNLDPRAVELVLDRRHAPVHREHLVEVFRHLREHRFHRGQEAQASRAQSFRSLEERDIRDHPEVPEKHVGRPHGIQVYAGRVCNPLEHDALVHADPHLAEHILQEHVPFAFRRPAEEGLQQPPTHPRRVRPVGLRDPRERLRDTQDAQGLRDEAGLLRPSQGLLERRPSDVQGARVRLREDAADDQVDRGRDLVPSKGPQKCREERALLEPFRRGLELLRQLRESGKGRIVRGRRRHGESGPSEAAGFKVSPPAFASVGPRRM